MGYLPSLGGKAAHLVSDLATVILNPVSGHERERSSHHLPEAAEGQENMYDDEESEIPNGPDTSSFRAFLMSFMSASSSSDDSMEIIPEQDADMEYPTLTPVGRGNKERKGLLSRGKHSIGKIINKAGRLGGFRQKPSHIIDGEIASQIESVSSGFRPKERTGCWFTVPGGTGHLYLLCTEGACFVLVIHFWSRLFGNLEHENIM